MKQELDKSVRAYGGAQQYDFDNRILLQWYPRRVMAQVGQARSLLELGLGHGYTADIFSRHFERHVVLD